jgi:hypothetical protein
MLPGPRLLPRRKTAQTEGGTFRCPAVPPPKGVGQRDTARSGGRPRTMSRGDRGGPYSIRAAAERVRANLAS